MIYILIVVLVAGGEYLIKNDMDAKLLKNISKEILGGRIVLNKAYNKGMMLNFLQEKKELVKTVSGVFLGLLLLLFAVTLPRKGNRLYKFGLALVLGGAVSNVSDRLLRGHVIDYFSIKSDKCKKLNNIVFNLADFAIFIGSLLVLLSSVVSTVFKSCTDKSAE